ncbi:MAG: small multi-drug export protein [Candidatus Saccharibacteria bacterium]|nr:small multi-drug export protein [Candidatus Saccharibacteria bacterium]
MQDIIENLQQFGPLKFIQEWLQPFIIEIAQFTAAVPLVWQVVAVVVWSAIPFIESDVGVAIGIGVGVSPIPATIAAIVGNWLAVMAVIILTDKARTKLRGEKEAQSESKRSRRVMRAMQKFGVPGASLLGPLLVGTHLNAFCMAAAGVNKRYLMVWQTIAIVVWAIIFAAVMSGLMASVRG